MRAVLADLPPDPKIAILRGGGLGDFLVTTPALRALRAARPDAALVLLTTPYLAPLAGRYDALDRVVLVPPYKGLVAGTVDDAALAAFFAAMQAEHFDLALQWHGGGQHSNGFLQRLGARCTAGFRGPGAPPLDYTLPYDPRQHEVRRYVDLLTLLGAAARGTALDLPLLPSDEAELAALGAVDLAAWRAGALVGVSLGASGPSRRWAPERFAAVVNALAREYDLPAVVVDAPPEQRPAAVRFVAAFDAPARAIDLAGRTSPGALIALISRYRLYLANDSGPAHIANALGTPTVVVFGSANPLNWAPLERTWQRVVADWSAPCRYLADDGCAEDSYPPCLERVAVADVLAEARDLLAQQAVLGGWPSRAAVAAAAELPEVAAPPAHALTRA